MSFEKEFLLKWNLFQINKATDDLYDLIDTILAQFESVVSIEIHEALNLVENNDELTNKIVEHEWPDQIFYFINEEIANLNRFLAKITISDSTGTDQENLSKIVKILKACLILSKNLKCLDLIINTSIINQFLNTSTHILKTFKPTSEHEVKLYFKYLCFLLMKAHDQNLTWLHKYFNFKLDEAAACKKRLQQRQFFYKFDQTFFTFFFEAIKQFSSSAALVIHTYMSALNEFTLYATLANSSNQIEILLRAITPQMIDYLFKLFYEKDADTTNEEENKLIYLNEYINLVVNKNEAGAKQQELLFYDKKLVVCRSLPLLVNILHVSLPDKRQVDLTLVLEKCMLALEEAKRADIKLEIIRAYLQMIEQCVDKAALKIVIVSTRFFTCLLEQIRLVSLTALRIDSFNFLHEFIKLSLVLIKNLVENSQSVRDTLARCECYKSLYEILKNTSVLDKDIAVVMNLMVNEVTLSAKQELNLDREIFRLDELKNCEMSELLIKLLPFMQEEAQEFSLNNTCRLCTLNHRNQLKSCNNKLLFNLICLLESHDKFSSASIEKLFRTIQSLGKCSINHVELIKLIELLQPRKQFPYGVHVLRCFVVWSKYSSSIGANLGFLSLSNSELSSLYQTDSDVTNKKNLVQHSILTSVLRTAGTGALSANAQQQAKHFFDFQFPNSGIIVPAIKKWPGYAFTFHAWIKLRSDLELFDKKRRQLYSFYSDSGQGFEAFFTPDCSSLVVSVCTKREFLSVQLRELDFDSSQSSATLDQSSSSTTDQLSSSTYLNETTTTNTSDYWHSITIIHKPAKGPFSSSQVCIYIDGILKNETDLKLPNFSEQFSQIRVGAACAYKNQTTQTSSLQNSFRLVAPFKRALETYKGSYTEKSLNVTSIPSGSQDSVWDTSTCLIGQMSSCFVLHDVLTDLQARLIYELGPNQFSINWLDLPELVDLKSKFLFHYDAKCAKHLTCVDLSPNKLTGKFSGENFICNNFKESLNSIGSIQIFYPLLNYLASNQEYYDLVVHDWSAHTTKNDSKLAKRASSFDDSEIEQNVLAYLMNLFRHLFHNNELIQDRLERNNGIALLSFLLQRSPKRFIDINLLRMCQEFVSESASLASKDLLNAIYEHLVFDFRIWNKADYEIRIGHIQYISTIIKDDKKYFRKKYGIQFFLDVIRTYFGSKQNQLNLDVTESGSVSQSHAHTNLMNDEDLRNLRNSFFGLIKYYAHKEIKMNELNAIISFLSTTRNAQFQNDMLDMLISLIENPHNSNEQLILRLFEPNLADSFYALLTQCDISYQIQFKLVKAIRLLLRTKKVYEKNKSRLRLDECGGYSGLVSKINSEYWFAVGNSSHKQSLIKFNEQIVIDLLNNLFLDETIPASYDSVWHIISLLTVSSALITDLAALINIRLNVCKFLNEHIEKNPQAVRMLTKLIAWQDVLCQLLCVDKKARKSACDPQAPEILVSSASHFDKSTPMKQEVSMKYTEPKFSHDNLEDSNEDIWENLEQVSLIGDATRKVKKQQISKMESCDSKMITSTPSPEKTLGSGSQFHRRMTDVSDDQAEFDKKFSHANKSSLLKKAIANSVNDSARKELVFAACGEKNKPLVKMDSLQDDECVVLEQEIDQFCESILDLMFKLTWDGVAGSSEDVWKERCQIFSSMHRLSLEYELVKPREYFEVKLIEFFLKQCISDAKKAGSVKETSAANENSRELIKLIDFFAKKNERISVDLASMTITLLDQMRAFESNFSNSPENSVFFSNPDNFSQSLNDSIDIMHLNTNAPTNKNSTSLNLNLSVATLNQMQNLLSNNLASGTSPGGLVHDELTETSYLGLNILISFIHNKNIDICGQAAAKINSILYNRSLYNCEEAGYLISNVEQVMYNRLQHEMNSNYEEHYASLIPVLKNLINKAHHLLQLNSHVPNIPFNKISSTPYEDFKVYCTSDEWRSFIDKHVNPLRDQYLAMAINPCQMNIKLWWTLCKDSLMQSIHKRNRLLGESKIKFEDTIFNNWKEREKQEMLRYQNFLIHLKRTNLAMRKQLHYSLKYFTSERGVWNEGHKEVYWMLSNRENRERMRCKLVENLQFDSHYEASRLRDYSDYTYFNYDKEINKNATNENLAQNFQINKEAINVELNEDNVAVDEQQQHLQQQSQQIQSTTTTSPATTSGTQTPNQISLKTVQPELIEAQLEEKEKLLEKSECELITVTRTIKGRFELTNKYIYFFDTYSSFYYEPMNENDSDIIVNSTSNNNANSSGFSCHDFDILNDFKIPLNQLKDVQIRRYNLRRSALEFFLIDETNYFINFNKNIRDKIYRRLVSMRLPNMQSYLSVRTPAELLKATDYTQRWCNHEMSNFEYLMKLNTIAGRSYNDLTQYPVFPWILKDYESSELDLTNESVYRDLSKPVGVLNKKFEDYVRQKYELFEDPTGTMRPFHYGTHYSNSANVMHFLIRLEPFTTLHIQLQSDRFDVADRQFYSIPSTWKVIYDNPNDVKELIPEFFYLPEFLENMNNFDFGELQITKNKVNNVQLPAWAKNPEHFIHMHRKALESDYVSEHLNEWIDLIFGYKQQGSEAEKALNVFMYCSYEGAIDLDAITDPVARHATEGMISNFGQTPTQLLKEPHVKRKSREQAIRDKILQGKPIILWHQLTNLKAYYVELCDPKNPNELFDPVVFISIPRNHVKSFMQQSLSDPLLSITQSGVIGVNGWQAYERSLSNLFSFEKDPSLLSEKTKKSIAGPFDPNLEIDNRLFVLTHDSKLLITGGHWDNSLRVFSLAKYRNISQIYQHSNIVTCLALDYTGTLMVSGSMDTTCMLWQIVLEHESSVNLDPKPVHILYGHTDGVTSVDISIELDLIVSASLDGTVNIHTIRKGDFIKSISFQNEKISRFLDINLKLGNQRHLLIYTSSVLNSLAQISAVNEQRNIYELYLFSVNGRLISYEKLANPVQDMLIKDDYCILAVTILNQSRMSQLSQSSNNKQTNYVSKIVFKENYDLKTIQVMRLKSPITCIFLTREDSHLLVGLRDGKLIVITGDRQI